MFASLSNFRFFGTTVSYDELLVAWENVVDKVAKVPTARNKSIYASAPMNIGMAATGDGENSRAEGNRETWTSHCRLFTEE